MSTAARKARKRAGIKFQHTVKVPTQPYLSRQSKLGRESDLSPAPLWVRAMGGMPWWLGQTFRRQGPRRGRR